MKTYSVNNALRRHPEITLSPVAISALRRRFRTYRPDSIRSLLIAMGPFVPTRDGFPFRNSFGITAGQLADFTIAFSREIVTEVAGLGLGRFRSILRGITIPIPLAPDIHIPGVIVNTVVDRVSLELTSRLIDAIAEPFGEGGFGRCGGMAFAGFDFYRQDWPVDTFGPTPPNEGVLGEYIYSRLLDSLTLNARTFLEWEMELHILPRVDTIAAEVLLATAGSFAFPIGPAIGAWIGSRVDLFDLGGPRALLTKTIEQWPLIKERLDQQAAWPIGLIYGNRVSPFAQHQILATGYTDNGLGRATLTIWDNNDGPQETELRIDFRGSELQVERRPPLTGSDLPEIKGFFLERYVARRPPLTLRRN